MKAVRWISCCVAGLLTAGCMFILSGCSTSGDISNRMLIQGVGIDISERGYLVSVHYAKPSDENVEVDLIQAEGETVYTVLQGLIMQTGLVPTYSHNSMVVFSRECAEKGLTDVFDFFVRYYETRPTVDLFVAEDRADTLFEMQDGEQYVLARKAKSFSEADVAFNKFAGSTVLDITDRMAGECNTFALPELTVYEKWIRLGKTAYFRDNQLIGYLDADQAKGYAAAVHTISNGILALQVEDVGTVGMRLERTHHKTTVELEDGLPKFTVNIFCTAYISEVNHDFRQRLSVDVYEKFERALEEQMKMYAESAIAQAAVQDGVDIFRFDTMLQQQQTAYWKEHAANWTEMLPKIKYMVNVQASVDRVQQEATHAV